ncbi:MAG: AAA family ATPase, partial [Planctomycetota bacterium]
RSRQRPEPARPDGASPASAPTIVLEPDRETARATRVRDEPRPEPRAQGDHSSRLDALYMDDAELRTPPEPSPRVVEPKPEPRRERPTDRTDAPVAPPASADQDVASELAELKKMMGQVLRTSRAQNPVALPPALEGIHDALHDSDLSDALVDRVIGGVIEELRPDELRDESVVRQVAVRRLASLIPVDGSLARHARSERNSPLVIALVGPTGVGKTTTVAKLAATYKLRHGASVGLVTSDTYRIAAVDQLRTYANIIGLPIQVTLTPAEMAQAVRGFHEHDVVILDTAGRSQNDTDRIDELRGFLDAARPDHTQLVLSATSSPKVIERITRVFGALEPTHAIATKLDEAASLGPIVEAVRSLNTPLSFVTTGQEVPDQIEPADAERLARRMLAPDGMSHSFGGGA